MPTPAPIALLAETTVSASAVGAVVAGLARYPGIAGVMSASAVPAGGAPTLDVYLQASADGGVTWNDVVAFQFAGAIAKRLFQVSQFASPGTATLAASDGALTTNTSVQGPFGDQLRVKYTFTAGGSTGSYTLSVLATPVGAH